MHGDASNKSWFKLIHLIKITFTSSFVSLYLLLLTCFLQKIHRKLIHKMINRTKYIHFKVYARIHNTIYQLTCHLNPF